MAQGDDGSVWLGPLGALMSGQDPLSPTKEPRGPGRYQWGWPQDPRAQTPTPHSIPAFPQVAPGRGVRTYRQGGRGSGKQDSTCGHQLGFQERARQGNQEGDWIPTDLHMWGVWALHRDTPTELFSVPKTKLVCTKPEVTIPLASAEVGRNRILAGRGVGEDGIWKSTSPWRKIPNYGRKEKSSAWVRKM